MDDRTPAVSVIMATYNGAGFIRPSINSILSQTWRDFELIIIDDNSTDGTAALLASLDDNRIRIIRNPTNLGVVEARNRAFAAARGRYVAMLDHDDLSRPTRLAKQVAYLDAHPKTVLVATGMHGFEDGRLTRSSLPRQTSPMLIHWLLHVANPLTCSSVMFRASAVHRLGVFMRAGYDYADDFDLYHRLKALGEIAQIDECLTIYRLHPTNTFRRYETTMIANAVKVMVPAYARWFGDGAEAAASAIAHHLSAGRGVTDVATLEMLAARFDHLNRSFEADFQPDSEARKAIAACAGSLWRRMMQQSARGGHGIGLATWRRAVPSGFRPPVIDQARLLLGRWPVVEKARTSARDWLRRPRPDRTPAPPVCLFDTNFQPLEPDGTTPPTLFVVVDTEAEFDWGQSFARDMTAVTAIDAIERGQAVFDRYGLRPIYVVDFPIASQPRSVAALRRILDRGACEIGAHLHPWTTPPFDEALSSRNSYAGNLPPELEEKKLARLVQAIRDSFGVSPRFFKAGRYGIGAGTAATLARHDIKVDLSILPGADLRRRDGPHFRGLQSMPYRLGAGGVLTLPMTRGHVGLLPAFGEVMETVSQLPWARRLRVRSVMARLRLVDTITLTPEGATAAEQIRLVRSLLRRGQRLFVLHYHSPSLSAGHTPYVRSAADADAFVARLQEVARFFFDEIGGMAGNPADLIDDMHGR